MKYKELDAKDLTEEEIVRTKKILDLLKEIEIDIELADPVKRYTYIDDMMKDKDIVYCLSNKYVMPEDVAARFLVILETFVKHIRKEVAEFVPVKVK